MACVGSEIVLVDENKKRAEAEANDILHAVAFAHPTRVYAGDYGDLQGSRVVIIAARFVETRFEYDANVWAGFRLGLWSKGSWLAGRGMAKIEGKYTTNHPGLTATPLDEETMTFSRYNIAAGLALKLSF